MSTAAELAAITTLSRDGVRVLSNVATGRSPWHGWEGTTAARTPESQEAYTARARAITECRDRGVLTPENLLTDMGRRLLSEWEGRRG